MADAAVQLWKVLYLVLIKPYWFLFSRNDYILDCLIYWSPMKENWNLTHFLFFPWLWNCFFLLQAHYSVVVSIFMLMFYKLFTSPAKDKDVDFICFFLARMSMSWIYSFLLMKGYMNGLCDESYSSKYIFVLNFSCNDYVRPFFSFLLLAAIGWIIVVLTFE